MRDTVVWLYKRGMTRLISLASMIALSASLVAAPPPRILDARAEKSGMGWDFEVVIEHPDTGWDHYADGWVVLDEAGNALGYRKLHHPHVTEQPFARGLRAIMIPDGTRKVYIRATCSKTGEESALFELKLNKWY